MVTVLFVCVENSCRSQIAEGFAKELGKGILEAYSAGSRPSGKVDPAAVNVMMESGIDISRQASKGFETLPVKAFDYVITLGCKDACPFIPGKEHIEWHIDDPKGGGIDFFRKTREAIKGELVKFLGEIQKQDS